VIAPAAIGSVLAAECRGLVERLLAHSAAMAVSRSAGASVAFGADAASAGPSSSRSMPNSDQPDIDSGGVYGAVLRLKVCARDVAMALAGPGSTRELLDARAASAV